MAEGINVNVIEYTDNRPVLVLDLVMLDDDNIIDLKNNLRNPIYRICFWPNRWVF